MRQLNSIEHMFIDMEAGNFSLDVSSLHFYDPSTAPRGKVTFAQVFKRFEQGVAKVPVLRRKLIEVPLGADHPYWVDDPHFDLGNHLEHIELTNPGDWDQLMDTVSELFSRSIPRDRPLWFGAVITGIDAVDGLPENGYALFLKMHHAAIDGASGRAIQEAIHDLQPRAPRRARSSTKEKTDNADESVSSPSRLSLLARAYPSNLGKAVRSSAAMIRAVPALSKEFLSQRGESDGDEGAGASGFRISLPETVFNPPKNTGEVRIDGRIFPLADVKAMRLLVPGATLNDVVFAIIAGAMRRYMEAFAEVPDEPLTSGMPMDVRGEDDGDATVMVTAVLSKLFTDVEDPVERLALSRDSNRAGKDSPAIRSARPMMSVLENAPHLLMSPLIKAVAWLGERSKLIAMHSLITNVPGIPVPIYLAGGRMVGLMGVVPVAGRTALTHAVFSTPDTLSITATCDKAVMDDTEAYMDCLEASFDEYLELLD